MTTSDVVNIVGQALLLTLKVAGPFLVANLLVGVVTSVFQSVFSVQEQSLSFVPKLAASALVLVTMGGWMLGQITAFVGLLFHQVPHLLAGH